jgi:putative chitinase
LNEFFHVRIYVRINKFMTIDLQTLKAIFPHTKSDVLAGFVDPLNKVFEKYSINTMLRKAAFLSQVGHESTGLSVWAENLNYSAERLMQVFPRAFPTRALAAEYAGKPEKIGARVYANRLGNYNESTGDGYTYRGRGLIQLTGKANYQAFATAFGMSLDEAVEYMTTLEGAAMSAGWFWDSRKINSYADRGDAVGMTKCINGGTNGLQERVALYNLCKSVLAKTPDDEPVKANVAPVAPVAAPVHHEPSLVEQITSAITPSTEPAPVEAPADTATDNSSTDTSSSGTLSSILNVVESVVAPSKAKKTTMKKKS